MLGIHSSGSSREDRFLLLGLRPHSVIDGDTLRVEILAPHDWEKTLGPARRSQSGEVWIRLLGLDAPETHFPDAPRHLNHQPPMHGQSACAILIESLKMSASFDDGEIRIQSHQPLNSGLSAAPIGYLLAEHMGIDRYGRVLAFIWHVDATFFKTLNDDFDPIFLGIPESNQSMNPFNALELTHESSINCILLAEGAAYPDFHLSIGHARIAILRRAVKAAQMACRGIWASDQTRVGIRLLQAQDISLNTLILPRFYRRIAAFMKKHESLDLAFSKPRSEEMMRGAFRYFISTVDQQVQLHSSNQTTLMSDLFTWNSPSLGIQSPLEDLEWH